MDHRSSSARVVARAGTRPIERCAAGDTHSRAGSVPNERRIAIRRAACQHLAACRLTRNASRSRLSAERAGRIDTDHPACSIADATSFPHRACSTSSDDYTGSATICGGQRRSAGDRHTSVNAGAGTLRSYLSAPTHADGTAADANAAASANPSAHHGAADAARRPLFPADWFSD